MDTSSIAEMRSRGMRTLTPGSGMRDHRPTAFDPRQSTHSGDMTLWPPGPVERIAAGTTKTWCSPSGAHSASSAGSAPGGRSSDLRGE
jgi:hypothetical protein